MRRLTRDGTAEPVSRDHINFPCSADHEQDWQPYPVDPYTLLRVMIIQALETGRNHLRRTVVPAFCAIVSIMIG